MTRRERLYHYPYGILPAIRSKKKWKLSDKNKGTLITIQDILELKKELDKAGIAPRHYPL